MQGLYRHGVWGTRILGGDYDELGKGKPSFHMDQIPWGHGNQWLKAELVQVKLHMLSVEQLPLGHGQHAKREVTGFSVGILGG